MATSGSTDPARQPRHDPRAGRDKKPEAKTVQLYQRLMRSA
jgi:hypothetical protein